jgi:ATP-dependent DNA helicase RecG
MERKEAIELIESIHNRKYESRDIELKSGKEGNPKKFYDTLSSFSNTWLSGFFDFLVRVVSLWQNVVVITINNTQITAFDIIVGGFIVSICFGLFLFIAPRFSKGV